MVNRIKLDHWETTLIIIDSSNSPKKPHPSSISQNKLQVSFEYSFLCDNKVSTLEV